MVAATAATESKANKADWATDIYYAPGAVSVKATDRDRLAAALEANKQAFVCSYGLYIVIGHAAAYEEGRFDTLALSKQRAEVLAQLLTQLGVPVDSVFSEGKGLTQPVAPRESAANARAEIEYVPCRHR